jgi:SAM-dependent methyltransferase
VTGVDLSGPLVDLARARGAGPEFVFGDAATIPLPPSSFDAAFSRFGVMFFEDPPAAFAHVRELLKPGGRLAFVCWRAMQENAWAWETLAVALPLLKEPPPAMPPDAPGPFSLAEAARIESVLRAAGWEQIAATPFDTDYVLGGSPEQAVELFLRLGPLGRLIREQQLDPGSIRGALQSLMARHVGERGVSMRAACWIVTARRP